MLQGLGNCVVSLTLLDFKIGVGFNAFSKSLCFYLFLQVVRTIGSMFNYIFKGLQERYFLHPDSSNLARVFSFFFLLNHSLPLVSLSLSVSLTLSLFVSLISVFV